MMEIVLTPEEEAKLTTFAAHFDRAPAELLLKAALRMVEEEDRFQAAVQEGLDQANRGQFIEEDEMNARIERMLQRGCPTSLILGGGKVRLPMAAWALAPPV